MGLRIATFAVILMVATMVAFRPAWPGGPGPARAQTGFVDLVVTKSDNPDPVLSGDPLTYTIVVGNNGDLTAGSPGTPVNIIDQLPSQFSSTPAFFITPSGTCDYPAPARIHCQVDTLGPGESVTITIDGYVTLPFGGSVLNSALVDLPVSQISEAIEVSNNIAQATTTILAISTPSPTPTPTPTATASPTETPTLTSTPTTTPRPVGGVSYDVAGRSPEAASHDSPSPDGVPIAGVIGVVAGLLAASGYLRYVKRRAQA